MPGTWKEGWSLAALFRSTGGSSGSLFQSAFSASYEDLCVQIRGARMLATSALSSSAAILMPGSILPFQITHPILSQCSRS